MRCKHDKFRTAGPDGDHRAVSDYYQRVSTGGAANRAISVSFWSMASRGVLELVIEQAVAVPMATL
ncbi:MAG TPA: hypothetical protein VK390_15815 [Propionibacteriaceae bacterium]|nr:hypothetical protein [Propionibacteriaceae bacterium]